MDTINVSPDTATSEVKCTSDGGDAGTASGVGATNSMSTDGATTIANQVQSDDNAIAAAPEKAKKRRLSPTANEVNDGKQVEGVSAKRRAPSRDYEQSRLLHCSDEVLLHILKYLNSSSLESLGE